MEMDPCGRDRDKRQRLTLMLVDGSVKPGLVEAVQIDRWSTPTEVEDDDPMATFQCSIARGRPCR